jgi:hypothetical protein
MILALVVALSLSPVVQMPAELVRPEPQICMTFAADRTLKVKQDECVEQRSCFLAPPPVYVFCVTYQVCKA